MGLAFFQRERQQRKTLKEDHKEPVVVEVKQDDEVLTEEPKKPKTKKKAK